MRLTESDQIRAASRICSPLLVFFLVCSLAVSVATRYTSQSSSASSNTIVHKHSSPETSRQRLTKEVADWFPPLISAEALEAPASYPRIAPAGPPMPGTFFETNLYNRPPPAL
jgi:hypothetical protein